MAMRQPHRTIDTGLRQSTAEAGNLGETEIAMSVEYPGLVRRADGAASARSTTPAHPIATAIAQDRIVGGGAPAPGAISTVCPAHPEANPAGEATRLDAWQPDGTGLEIPLTECYIPICSK
jgi:hypothetical protein